MDSLEPSRDKLKTARPIHPAQARGGARPRVTARQAREWADRVRSGEDVVRIAREAAVDPRTVAKHVGIVREGEERDAIRRDLLQQAMQAHQEHHLWGTAKALEKELRSQTVGNAGGDPRCLRAAGKPLEALLHHARGSGLSGQLQDWSHLVARWDAAMTRVRQRLAEQLQPWGVIMDGTLPLLVDHVALAYARGGTSDLRLLGWHAGPDGGLRLGAYGILDADSTADPDTIRRRIETFDSELPAWSEVGELRRLHVEAGRLRNRLVDLLEDLVMRRYFDGACPWCPGTHQSRRRRAFSSAV